MHVEIDDGDAFGAMRRAGVPRRDGDIVEKAEAHRRSRAGVMAGRAHGDEGRVRRAGHHLVDRRDAAASGVEGRLQRLGAHHRVRVERGQALPRGGLLQRAQICFGMHAQQRLARGQGRRATFERLESLMFEASLDDAQTIRPLGVAGAHVMRQRTRMGDEKGSHRLPLWGKSKIRPISASIGSRGPHVHENRRARSRFLRRLGAIGDLRGLSTLAPSPCADRGAGATVRE
jgi:hypothetical protein